jgi:hypothetical protein
MTVKRVERQLYIVMEPLEQSELSIINESFSINNSVNFISFKRFAQKNNEKRATWEQDKNQQTQAEHN